MLHRRKTFDLQDKFREVGEHSKGADHRPFLTWEWNDRLDAAEVRRQIRCFSEADFRGFIITPAAGLLCRPLDTEWMDALEAAVDEAQRHDLKVCLRDRMQLPSLSLAKSNQQPASSLFGRVLRVEILPLRPNSVPPPGAQNTIAWYSARQVNGTLFDIQLLAAELAVDEELLPALSPSDSTAPPSPSDALNDFSPAEEQLAAPHGRAAQMPMDRIDSPAENGAASESTEDIVVKPSNFPLNIPPSLHEGSTDRVPDASTEGVLLHLYTEFTKTLDPLSGDAVRAFIEGPPENYFREFGAEFGKTITGFVVEIPGFTSPPWSEALSDLFQEMFGEDLLNILPCVLCDCEAGSQGRLQFWSAVNSLFARSCTGQIEAWCRNREIRFWGRFDGNGSLADQMAANAGVMRQYAAASGILLSCSDQLNDDVLPFKQAASAVNQEEDTRLLAELSLEGEQSASLAQSLAAAVEAVALGATNLCTSRVPFSLRGFRKNQSHSFSHPQLPSWPLQSRLNQYLARLQFLLNRGQPATSLAILHPLRAAWRVSPGSLEATDKMLHSFMNQALESFESFDFVGETLLQSKASVQKDKLRVGQARYGAVLVPPEARLAPSTIVVLEKYLEAGGSVYQIQTPPAATENQKTEQGESALQWAHLVSDISQMLQELQKRKDTSWRVQKLNGSAEPLLCHPQDAGRYQFLLLANRSSEESIQVRVAIAAEGRLEAWDLATGLVTPLETKGSLSEISTETNIPPASLLLIGLDTARPPWRGAVKKDRVLQSIQINGGWNLSLKDPNILVLGPCSYKAGSDEWRSAGSMSEAFSSALNGATGDELLLRFAIHINAALALKDLYLAVEDPKRWKVVINGVPLPPKDAGSSSFGSMRQFEVSRLLTAGKNIVMLSGPLPIPPEPSWPEWRVSSQSSLGFQPCLIGHFEVSTSSETGPIVIDQPGSLPTEGSFLQDSSKIGPLRLLVEGSHLENEGLPAFRGVVRLQANVLLPRRPAERIILSFNEMSAAAVTVRVNKKVAGTLLWPPYRLDITDFARAGKNSITLDLTTDGPGQNPRRCGISQALIHFVAP